MKLISVKIWSENDLRNQKEIKIYWNKTWTQLGDEMTEETCMGKLVNLGNPWLLTGTSYNLKMKSSSNLRRIDY